jgi:hypothetical protein
MINASGPAIPFTEATAMAVPPTFTRIAFCAAVAATVTLAAPLTAQSARLQLRGDTLSIEPGSRSISALQLVVASNTRPVTVLLPVRVVLPQDAFTWELRSSTDSAEVVITPLDSGSVRQRHFRTTLSLPLTMARAAAGEQVTYQARRARSEVIRH